MTLKEYLKQIADAIREKKGSTATIPAENFSAEILALSGGGCRTFTMADEPLQQLRFLQRGA